jgi:LacI family transcriptional regulator
MQVSQQEIAAKLGVTQKAVSLALRGKTGVSPEVRAEIIKTAKMLGYRPNTAARNMRKGRFGAIGILSSMHAGPSGMSNEMLWAIQQELVKFDTHLLMSHVPDEDIEDASLPLLVREWCVDGLLVDYTSRIPESLETSIIASKLPAVWVNVKKPVDAVYPDDFANGREITEKLLTLGHRNITFLTKSATPATSHYSVADRVGGYAEAMNAAGLTPDVMPAIPTAPELSAAGVTKTQHAMKLGPKFLAGDDRPTAVISNAVDYLVGMIEAAHEQGLQVPRDLSVIGYGHRPEHRLLIGSINPPQTDMGAQAIDMLMNRIDESGQDRPAVVLPLKIDLGNTVVAPA